MIRSGKDMVQEVRERMQDGKGQVEMTHIFTQDELGSKIRLCARISIPPGGVHRLSSPSWGGGNLLHPPG